MTKEQEESLEKLKRQILIGECEKNIGMPVFISDLKNVLSMLKEKDKMIDLMAEQLTTPMHNKEYVKQYFENKANGGNER